MMDKKTMMVDRLKKDMIGREAMKPMAKTMENHELQEREIKPQISFYSSKLPEQEGWEVGKTYRFIVNATLKSIETEDDDTRYSYDVEQARVEEKEVKNFEDAIEKARSELSKKRDQMENKSHEKEIRVVNRTEPYVG